MLSFFGGKETDMGMGFSTSVMERLIWKMGCDR